MLSMLSLIIALSTAGADGPAGPKVEFLTVDQGRRVVGDDTDYPYFSLLGSAEIRAKTGSVLSAPSLNLQRKGAQAIYLRSCLEFTADERAMLTAVAGEVHRVVQPRFPKVARLPWRFIKVQDRIEGGFPHTRGSCIVLAQSILADLMRLHGSTAEHDRLRPVALLAHEQLHILQRARPQLFDDLYTRVWGFVRAKHIDSCAWLEERQLINPDAPDPGWVFPLDADGKAYIWPNVYLARTDTPTMQNDFVARAIKVEKVKPGHFKVVTTAAGEPLVRPLESVTEYASRFCSTTSGLFHPHEASATLFSQIVAAYATRDLERAEHRRIFLHICEPTAAWFKEKLK